MEIILVLHRYQIKCMWVKLLEDRRKQTEFSITRWNWSLFSKFFKQFIVSENCFWKAVKNVKCNYRSNALFNTDLWGYCHCFSSKQTHLIYVLRIIRLLNSFIHCRMWSAIIFNSFTYEAHFHRIRKLEKYG